MRHYLIKINNLILIQENKRAYGFKQNLKINLMK